MSETTCRSDCPINYLLEIVGDKWSLLIIRDMILDGKTSYGEFLASDEKIATNILANRLSSLEAASIIVKKPHPSNGTKFVYSLTDKGLDLLPLFVEIILWSEKHAPFVISKERLAIAAEAKRDKAAFIAGIERRLREGVAPLAA